MPTRSTPALGLAVLIGALLLSGCGSSSKSPSSSSTAAAAVSAAGGPTKAQFTSQAEAICRSLAGAEKPLEARQAALKSEASSSGAFVAVARQVVSLSRAADAKLHALPRPAAYAAPIGKLLAAFSEDVAYANELAQAAAKAESDIGEAAERGLRRSITANSHLADEYGLKLCTGGE